MNNFHLNGMALRVSYFSQASIIQILIQMYYVHAKNSEKESLKIHKSAQNLILWSQCYLSYLYHMVFY